MVEAVAFMIDWISFLKGERLINELPPTAEREKGVLDKKD